MISSLYMRFRGVLDHRRMGRDVTTRIFVGAACRTLVVALCVAAPAAVALAHPFGERYYAHRVVLRAHEASLVLQYSGEIPAGTVMQRFAAEVAGVPEVGEAQDRAFTEQILAEMASELSVYLDGEAAQVSWGPREGQPSGVGTGEFFAYHLHAELPMAWTETPVEILVTNNYALDWPAYYSGWIFADPGVTIIESSLRGMGETASQDDVFQQADAWSRNPVYRDVAAQIAASPPQVEESAVEAPPQRSRRWLLPTVLVAAVIAVGLTAMAARRRR